MHYMLCKSLCSPLYRQWYKIIFLRHCKNCSADWLLLPLLDAYMNTLLQFHFYSSLLRNFVRQFLGRSINFCITHNAQCISESTNQNLSFSPILWKIRISINWFSMHYALCKSLRPLIGRAKIEGQFLDIACSGPLFSKSIAYEKLGKHYSMRYIYYSISLVFGHYQSIISWSVSRVLRISGSPITESFS